MRYFSNATKTALLLLAFALLSACANRQYVLVKKQSLDLAQQCLAAQQSQQQQLLTQQEQFAQTLTRLNDTLSHPLKLNAAILRQLPNQCDPQHPNTANIASAATPNGDKQLVGAVENVWFPQLKLTFNARIDTGATTSSIDARHVEPFERDGHDWVRFDLINPTSGDSVSIEHEIKRWVRIRQSSSDKLQRRPVVALQTVIGGVSQTAEFNLTDREGMDFSVLIGRNVLKDLMIVDVSKEHIAPIIQLEKSADKQSAKPAKQPVIKHSKKI